MSVIVLLIFVAALKHNTAGQILIFNISPVYDTDTYLTFYHTSSAGECFVLLHDKANVANLWQLCFWGLFHGYTVSPMNNQNWSITGLQICLLWSASLLLWQIALKNSTAVQMTCSKIERGTGDHQCCIVLSRCLEHLGKDNEKWTSCSIPESKPKRGGGSTLISSRDRPSTFSVCQIYEPLVTIFQKLYKVLFWIPFSGFYTWYLTMVMSFDALF